MPTMVTFDDFGQKLAEGDHDFSADAIRAVLTNTAPVAGTNTQLTDITQIAAGNGYTTGGFTLANVAVSETGGNTDIDADDLVIAASGGSMAQWRYIVLYNDDAPNDELIGYFDAGAAVDLVDGASRTLALSSNFLRVTS